MKTFIQYLILSLALIVFTSTLYSQDYVFEDFVGTWHGTISSEWNYYNDPISLTIYSDGFYTETSGRLMPSIYPNTQQCDYEASTNRMHFWYLSTVYAGQQTYTHIYYEIVSFENNVLEMHYNFWDDPEPNPDAGTIYLVKETATPSPENIMTDVMNSQLFISWDEPQGIAQLNIDLQGYNVYNSYDGGAYEFLAFTEQKSYLLEEGAGVGLNSYYITSVYDQGESSESDEISVIFESPEPQYVQGNNSGFDIILEWETPMSEISPIAKLLGYNIFHKYENGDFAFLEYTQYETYNHVNLNPGLHTYYLVAVYEGGESQPTNELEVSVVITGFSDVMAESINIYPNPTSDYVYIDLNQDIERISIVNQSGQVLRSVGVAEKKYTFDLNEFSSGIYFIIIETIDGSITKKISVI
jgi:hypothetical protein